MRTALWISLCLLVVGFATSADARAHKPLPNPKRPPDLQGVWSYNSLTRLERPDAYSAVTIGEAEARAVRPQPFIPPDAVGQAESETYDPEGLALARVG